MAIPKKGDDRQEKLLLRLPQRLLAAVDEWRRAQPDIPNRTEAIRRMIEIAAHKGRK